MSPEKVFHFKGSSSLKWMKLLNYKVNFFFTWNIHGWIVQNKINNIYLENGYKKLQLFHRLSSQNRNGFVCVSYPSARASSDGWVTLTSLSDSTEHDLNQSSFLSITESWNTHITVFKWCRLERFLAKFWSRHKKLWEIQVCTFAPSSPGNGSSSNRLIILSQSFSSSDAQSHKLSTR